MVMKFLPKKDASGRYPADVWPGGYPVFYVCADDSALCPACANGENESDASSDSEDKQWRLIGADIHWEGEPITCDHCNAQIESAYGIPEED